MRIAVAGYFGPRLTGIGRTTICYLKELQKIDKKNEYIIYLNRDNKNILPITNPNFRIVYYNVSKKKPIYNLLWNQIFLPYRVLKDKIDLLIIPNIIFVGRKFCPLLVFIRDLIEYQFPNQSFLRMIYRKATIPLTAKNADKIIAVSNNTRKDINEILKIPMEKIQVIYHGIDPMFKQSQNIDNEKKSQILQKYKIKGKYILYVGTVTHPQKNIHRLVKAYEQLCRKGVKENLVVCGGMGFQHEILLDEVKGRNLKNRVIFTGYVQDEDLYYIYRGAELFVFPSLYEGFGNPVLEAMASGVPTITSNSSSLKEIAGSAAIVVNPYNVGEIINAMYKILNDKKLREDLIKRGTEHVKEFNWSSSGKKLLDIIERM